MAVGTVRRRNWRGTWKGRDGRLKRPPQVWVALDPAGRWVCNRPTRREAVAQLISDQGAIPLLIAARIGGIAERIGTAEKTG